MSNPTGDNGLMKHWTVDHCPLRSCGSTVRGRLNDHNNARNKYLYQTFSKTQNCNLNWMNILYLTKFLTSYFISLDCYTKICWLCALLAFNGQVFFRQGRAFFSVITPLDLTCIAVQSRGNTHLSIQRISDLQLPDSDGCRFICSWP